MARVVVYLDTMISDIHVFVLFFSDCENGCLFFMVFVDPIPVFKSYDVTYKRGPSMDTLHAVGIYTTQECEKVIATTKYEPQHTIDQRSHHV